jgi:hypothetical protein
MRQALLGPAKRSRCSQRIVTTAKHRRLVSSRSRKSRSVVTNWRSQSRVRAPGLGVRNRAAPVRRTRAPVVAGLHEQYEPAARISDRRTLAHLRSAAETGGRCELLQSGSFTGVPSDSTSVRLTPRGPMPRSDTPCDVGCVERLLEPRNRLNVGIRLSTSSATTAGSAGVCRIHGCRLMIAIPHGRSPTVIFLTTFRCPRSTTDTSFDGPFAA